MVGTLVGEIVGEYVGDLLYVMTMGGGVDAVGDKLKEDWNNTIGNIVTACKAWWIERRTTEK